MNSQADIESNLTDLKGQLNDQVCLVAVSKTKPKELIEEAYRMGHRDFGENKIQEMCEKYEELPKDIRWHMIGHIQTNKVKYMASFVHLIHGVDSVKLLKEINKRANQHDRIIPCLIQVHIAKESTKFGFDDTEVLNFFNDRKYLDFPNVEIRGLMGMGTNGVSDAETRDEFASLKKLYDQIHAQFPLKTLSMGMSGDYKIAIEEGSNMVRVGSAIFGQRNYSNL